MHRFNSIFNNKIFRFSFILFIALGFAFLFPNDTYALEYHNPKMEVWGTKSGSSDLTTLISCDACSRIENIEGIPQFIRIYLPGSLFTSFTKYDLSFQFQWIYLGSNDVWPHYPILFLQNGILGTSEVVSNFGVHNWTYLGGVYNVGYWFRDHTFGATFTTAESTNLLTDNYYLDIPFFDTNHGNSSPYTLALKLELDHIDIIAEGSDEHLGIIVDNAKNEIIDSIIDAGHADQDRFDQLIDEDVSSGISKFDEFFESFKFKDNGGISSVLTMPIELLRSILTENTCNDLSIDILDTRVSFPNGCSFWNRVPENRLTLYRMLVCGLFCYILLTNLFHDIHYLKDPHSLGVDTLDL